MWGLYEKSCACYFDILFALLNCTAEKCGNLHVSVSTAAGNLTYCVLASRIQYATRNVDILSTYNSFFFYHSQHRLIRAKRTIGTCDTHREYAETHAHTDKGAKGTPKLTQTHFGSWSKLGQAGPWRESEAGQKVQQPNGEVEGPEGWWDRGAV